MSKAKPKDNKSPENVDAAAKAAAQAEADQAAKIAADVDAAANAAKEKAAKEKADHEAAEKAAAAKADAEQAKAETKSARGVDGKASAKQKKLRQKDEQPYTIVYHLKYRGELHEPGATIYMNPETAARYVKPNGSLREPDKND